MKQKQYEIKFNSFMTETEIGLRHERVKVPFILQLLFTICWEYEY